MARILLVDDEAACRDATTLLLTAHGHRVHAVARGADALEAIGDFQPELALIDWMLRDKVDGIELAARLAEAEPPLPSILITGFPGQGVSQRIARIPRCRCLAKPLAPGELLEAIAQTLGQNEG